MSIFIGVALSLIVVNKLIAFNTYSDIMKEEINKELKIIK